MGLEEITGKGNIAEAVDKSFARAEKYHLIDDVLKCTGRLFTFGIFYSIMGRDSTESIPGIVYG